MKRVACVVLETSVGVVNVPLTEITIEEIKAMTKEFGVAPKGMFVEESKLF